MILYFGREWRDDVSIPRYWTKAKIRIEQKSVEEMILLKSRRIMIVGEVLLNRGVEKNMNRIQFQFLEYFVANEDLEMRCLRSNWIRMMPTDPSILTKTVCRTKEVEMNFNKFQLSDCNAIFSEIALCKDLKLKKLDLDSNDIKGVDPRTLSSAVTRLTEVSLSRTSMSTNQLNYLLKDISCSKSYNLRILKLEANRLSKVPDDILAKAVCRLVEIDLKQTKITTEQLDALFTEISQASYCKLQNLNLRWNYNMYPTNVQLLAKAACRLVQINLQFAKITSKQVDALFTEIAQASDCKLQNLYLSCIDISHTNAQLLAKAVCRLVEIDLEKTKITPEQVDALFTEISQASYCKLQNLNLSCNDISHTNAQLLAKAVCRLVKVDLDETGITTEQLNALKETEISLASDCKLQIFRYY